MTLIFKSFLSLLNVEEISGSAMLQGKLCGNLLRSGKRICCYSKTIMNFQSIMRLSLKT